MANENRDFKGVWIPAEVWLDTRLNAIEKIILTEIDSLDSSDKGCWASNKYIAEFCQCSERTVSSAISKLIELGYLYVQSFDGRQRQLKSRFTKVIANETSKNCEADSHGQQSSNAKIASLPSKNCEADSHGQQSSNAKIASQPSKNCEAGLQNLRQSNTYNNTSNNKENIKEERKKESTSAEGTHSNNIPHKKTSTYDEILNAVDPQLKDYYLEYLKMRKMTKAPMTDRALNMLIEKVNKLEPNSIARQKQIIENAIINNWKSVYPLKDEKPQAKQPSGNIFLDIANEEGIF